jgi:hypothetical protein
MLLAQQIRACASASLTQPFVWRITVQKRVDPQTSPHLVENRAAWRWPCDLAVTLEEEVEELKRNWTGSLACTAAGLWEKS